MQDLTITQGDEKAYNLTFTSGGSPLNITGATLTMSVKRSLKDTALVFPAKVVTTHTAPTLGKTTVTLSITDTGHPLGSYYYDMQIAGAGIRKKTVLKGKLTITWQTTTEA